MTKKQIQMMRSALEAVAKWGDRRRCELCDAFDRPCEEGCPMPLVKAALTATEGF